eukprot:351033-Chlamydomonas_euryale.AAC.4
MGESVANAGWRGRMWHARRGVAGRGLAWVVAVVTAAIAAVAVPAAVVAVVAVARWRNGCGVAGWGKQRTGWGDGGEEALAVGGGGGRGPLEELQWCLAAVPDNGSAGIGWLVVLAACRFAVPGSGHKQVWPAGVAGMWPAGVADMRPACGNTPGWHDGRVALGLPGTGWRQRLLAVALHFAERRCIQRCCG